MHYLGAKKESQLDVWCVSADMSFPPHLNQIAQLPPGISPSQFAGFPTTVPTGNLTPIIPVAVGMMPPSPAVCQETAETFVLVSLVCLKINPVNEKHFLEYFLENQVLQCPTTTVFVGNISEKASDMLVRQMLAVSVGNLFNNFCLHSIIKSIRHVTFIELVLSRIKILSSFTHSYVIEHIKNGKQKFSLTCMTQN
uniref:Uncharacterized protein n=1 Tax=Cyprinus carpio TaxID=7962 RepID=A0A8C1SQN0_CYPCA